MWNRGGNSGTLRLTPGDGKYVPDLLRPLSGPAVIVSVPDEVISNSVSRFVGGHDRIQVFNRGTHAGELVVRKGDGGGNRARAPRRTDELRPPGGGEPIRPTQPRRRKATEGEKSAMPRKRTGIAHREASESGFYARMWIAREGVTRREFVNLHTDDRTLAARKMAKVQRMVDAGELVADARASATKTDERSPTTPKRG